MKEINDSCIISLLALLCLLLIMFAIDAIIAGILVLLYNILAICFDWIILSFWQMFIICIIIHLIKKFIV